MRRVSATFSCRIVDENQLPKIVGNAGSLWFRRWRKECGIIYKTSGMQLKVPWSKILKRVKVLLGNIFRIRCFWEHCHPSKPMRFISLDQKPSWFNNAGHKGTLGKKGCPQPGIQENFCQTRERYSIFTSVRNFDNDNPDEPPPVEILFRAFRRRKICQKLQSHPIKQKSWRCAPCVDIPSRGLGVDVAASPHLR